MAGAIVLGLLPVWVFVVLNAMRPDLMAEVLDSRFGVLFASAVTGLGALGATAYLAATLASFKRRWVPVAMVVMTAMVVTLPGEFLILFGHRLRVDVRRRGSGPVKVFHLR